MTKKSESVNTASSVVESAADRSVPALSRLRPAAGAVRVGKRRGRGYGSGLGKTSGKGQKGQKARHPGNFGRIGFEGGQTPLQRRLPKVGFRNIFSKDVAVVNLRDLKRFAAGVTVDAEALRSHGLIPRVYDSIKILAVGDLDRKLNVQAHAFSSQAKAKIEAAGGAVQLLAMPISKVGAAVAAKVAAAKAAKGKPKNPSVRKP